MTGRKGIAFRQAVLEDLTRQNDTEFEDGEPGLEVDDGSVDNLAEGDDVTQADSGMLSWSGTIRWLRLSLTFCLAFGILALNSIRRVTLAGGSLWTSPPFVPLSTPAKPPNVQVRVFNRHFSYIQTHEILVPVSHAWDDSIPKAKGEGVYSNTAASELMDTLEALFEGAEDACDAGVNFGMATLACPSGMPVSKSSCSSGCPPSTRLVEAQSRPRYTMVSAARAGTGPLHIRILETDFDSPI